MFDSERFNGFVRQELDNLVFDDLWKLNIFNESDLHSAAYFYVRRFFEKTDRADIYVRCEPQIAGMKPDIVVYDRGRPIYALEFKVFWEPDRINEAAIESDIAKLHRLIQKVESMKWGFCLAIYDRDEPYTFSGSRLRRLGVHKVSVTTVNARRTEDSQRRRVGYDKWRSDISRLRRLHDGYA